MSDFDSMWHGTAQADLDFLEHLVAVHALGGTVLEVGSWVGSSALTMVTYARRVYCVDHFQGSPNDRLGRLAKKIGKDELFRAFCKNVGDHLFEKIIPCVGSSEMWASVWREPLDLIFIDGDHSFASCLQDMRLWQPFVRRGGVLCGHDYSPQFPGVIKAVQSLIPPQELGTGGEAMWYTVFSE